MKPRTFNAHAYIKHNKTKCSILACPLRACKIVNGIPVCGRHDPARKERVK